MRGVYFASHFHNWYHLAEGEEISRYIEDLALWGVNTLMAIYPFINLQGWDDPEATPAVTQLRKLFSAAKRVGLSTTLGLNNVLFNDAPHELRATPLQDPLGRHGNSGATICPSLPAGRDLIMKTSAELLGKLTDIGVDNLILWPYDEGGCGCSNCRPWGANGFVRMSQDIAGVARSIFPRVKTILSTWTFDTPPEGEWAGLADALSRGNDWADYILADAHEDFPRYPLENAVPGNLPLINFPEISMWGNWPWGGCGAHPLPNRLQHLWNQAGAVLRGGFPYSEGIYEDINKAIVAQFYWNPDSSAQSTLREYAAFEYSPAVADMPFPDAGNVEIRGCQYVSEQITALLKTFAQEELVSILRDFLRDQGAQQQIAFFDLIFTTATCIAPMCASRRSETNCAGNWKVLRGGNELQLEFAHVIIA